MHQKNTRAMLALFLTATAATLAIAWGPPRDKANGDKPKVEALPTCPVMGEAIDFGCSVETDDGPVYLCCASCKSKYNDNKAKYADKVAEQRKMLAKRDALQTACPVSGEPIDEKVTVEQDGRNVAFCCTKCMDKYKADPAKYTAKVAASFTYQTVCPVMKEKLSNTSKSVELESGEKVYVCCKRCIAAMKKDASKFAANLESQGYHYKLKVKP